MRLDIEFISIADGLPDFGQIVLGVNYEDELWLVERYVARLCGPVWVSFPDGARLAGIIAWAPLKPEALRRKWHIDLTPPLGNLGLPSQ